MDASPFAIYDIGAGWLALGMDFFQNSFLFAALRAFLFVYVLVLFVDIVLLLSQRGLSGDLRATLRGTDRPLISRNKMIVRWEKIRERLESGNSSQYKVAILEAEALAEEILTGIGWKGGNMEERLVNITDAQLETRPGLWNHIRYAMPLFSIRATKSVAKRQSALSSSIGAFLMR
jgi:hypothetical protein